MRHSLTAWVVGIYSTGWPGRRSSPKCNGSAILSSNTASSAASTPKHAIPARKATSHSQGVLACQQDTSYGRTSVCSTSWGQAATSLSLSSVHAEPVDRRCAVACADHGKCATWEACPQPHSLVLCCSAVSSKALFKVLRNCIRHFSSYLIETYLHIVLEHRSLPHILVFEQPDSVSSSSILVFHRVLSRLLVAFCHFAPLPKFRNRQLVWKKR